MDNADDIDDEDLLDSAIQMSIEESCQNAAWSDRYEMNLRSSATLSNFCKIFEKTDITKKS